MDLKNLVIGNTSQLSYYFPDDYEKISSRNIDLTSDTKYNRIYLCFAEQRTSLKDNRQLFFDTNVDYTLSVIKHFIKYSNQIIVYGTSELWNNSNGGVDINTLFNYKASDYVDSKLCMVHEIKSHFPSNKVIILHPFNFNSIHRKNTFLFYKIFDSIINKKQISIGDTYFYRELLHTKYVVEQSITANSDAIIGAGRLVHINDFIRSLYSGVGLNYDDYVTENIDDNFYKEQKVFYLKTKQNLYNSIYNDTISEIKKAINNG